MNFKKYISSAFLLCAFLAISVTNISAQSNNSPSLSLDGFDALSVISDIPYLPALVDDLKEDPNSLNPKEEAYFMGELNISPEDFKKKSQAEQDALVEGYVSGKNKETTEFIEDFFAGDKGPAVSASVAPGASNKGFIPYHPLDGVGIAGLTDKATAGNLPSLLNAGYQLLIGIASVLAVVMIFYAGFRYATTVSPGAKTDAKNRILAALGGLLLALSSWLILSTIDADLVGVDLAFQSFEEGKLEFRVLSEEEVQNIYDTYGTTITVSAGGVSTVSAGSRDINQAGFNGAGSLVGIPVQGQRNRAMGNDGAHVRKNQGDIERHTERKVLENGQVWAVANASYFGGRLDNVILENETGTISNKILRNDTNESLGVALRFDYDAIAIAANSSNASNSYEKNAGIAKEILKTKNVAIYSPVSKKTIIASPTDWGPNMSLNRGIDVSKGVETSLGAGSVTNKPLYFRFVN